MKVLKYLGLMLFLMTSAHLSAANPKKTWHEYKSGPAIRLTSDFGIALDYYFLKDNQMSVSIVTTPYQYIKNLDGVLNTSGHNGGVIFSAKYYFRIRPNEMGNKLFASLGIGWREGFGELISVPPRKIQYSWGILATTGLQYRVSEHFYLGLEMLPIFYNSTQIKNNPNRITQLSIYYNGSAYVVYKF
jgi:hypothetical protein